MNRIHESNTKTFLNDHNKSKLTAQDRPKRAQEPPRAAQDPLKTAQKLPKTLQRGPKSPQERPKTPSRRPKNPPRSPLGTVLELTWDQPTTRSKTTPCASISPNFWGGFWSPKCCPKRPQDDPKTSQKSRRNMYHCCILLGPVLDRS